MQVCSGQRGGVVQLQTLSVAGTDWQYTKQTKILRRDVERLDRRLDRGDYWDGFQMPGSDGSGPEEVRLQGLCG